MLAAVVQAWLAVTVVAALALLGVMAVQWLVRAGTGLVAGHLRTPRLPRHDELRHVRT